MSDAIIEELTDGTEVPSLFLTPGAVDLFMFSASAWLLHRIHYDVPFTTEHDGHPALLIHGPLQGVYLVQSVQRWLGAAARLTSLTYRHQSPAYSGETLECGGSVISVDSEQQTIEFDLWVRSDGEMRTSGRAVYQLRPDSSELTA